MTPERWRRIEDLYHAALAKAEAERAAFLAAACADDLTLRDEVASLLAQPGFDASVASLGGAVADPSSVSLVSGQRLGTYELHERIGAGGMGEVYRARDTKLGREVAIKILPRAFMTDPDRLTRFEREARLLASLNHPHIAAIYGVEEADGIPALVLELVDGDTLADRIGGRPVPVEEARAVAAQIADALEAAHERGIVHRDLKPANIKVTPNGVVKVLDFGLAKVASGAGATMPAQAPTALSPSAVTGPGLVMGTPAYMSPEQARGQAVDKRTDIWAFGCVLYELLAGRPVFARATLTDTIAAVLHAEPDWTALPHGTPTALFRLLTRCLQKEPAKRLRDIGDARIELADLDEDAGTLDDHRSSGWLSIVAGAGIGAAIVASGVALWTLNGDREPSEPRPVRFTVALQADEQLQHEAGAPRPLAISSDGRAIAYVTRRASGNRIYLRRQQDVDGQPVVGTEGGSGPFFSPDGQWIGFTSGGFLRKVSVLGGVPQTIAPGANFFDASWSDDGSIVFDEWKSGLLRVSADGGMPEPLTTLDTDAGESAHLAPHALPGGRAVLFSVVREGRPPSVELIELSTGKRKSLTEGADPHYLSSGHILLTRDGRLYAAPFDLSTMQLTSPPAPAAEDVAVVVVQNRGAVSVALDGTLVYLPAASNVSRLVAVMPGGAFRTISSDQRVFFHPRLASDGNRVVVTVLTESGPSELWVYDLDRHTRMRASVNGISRPVWSHDGKRITFQKDGSLYSIPADDSAPPELVLARDEHATALFPLAWSRDGGTLVYSRPAPGTNRDVFTLPVGGTPLPFLATSRDERSAMLSPDGRWMAYAALETGREEEVYVQPYPGPGERLVISEGGGREPVWSPQGDTIFYRSPDGQRMIAATFRTEPRARIEGSRTLFQGSFRTGLYWAEYDVNSRTGEFVMLSVDEQVQPQLTVALNWLTPRRESATESPAGGR